MQTKDCTIEELAEHTADLARQYYASAELLKRRLDTILSGTINIELGDDINYQALFDTGKVLHKPTGAINTG